jgi:phospho-N-acetylmuramoyl-pentapeptide-transferase
LTDLATPFLLALIPAAVGAWPIYRTLLALKARQTVSQHVAEHAHKQGTPTMGGLIIVFGLLFYAIPQGLFGFRGNSLAGIPILLVTFALIGFVDDFVIPRLMKGKRGLGWTQKLLLQIACAGIAVAAMGPASGLALAFGVFAILFYANAYNFADGLDWLASTVLLALAGAAAVLALMLNMPWVAGMFLAMIGATLPFMVLNRPPARIFMGDVGSMPLGALLGLGLTTLAWPDVAPTLASAAVASEPGRYVAVTGINGWPVWAGIVVMSFVMFAELVPVPLQIASVKLRKKRLFPMTPIHHAFQKAGWKETRIVAMFFAVQVVCSLLGLGIAYAAVGAR